MASQKDLFITKFNELDELCRKAYSQKTTVTTQQEKSSIYDSIRTFAEQFEVNDKKAIGHLINLRNICSHRGWVKEVEYELVEYTQILIYIVSKVVNEKIQGPFSVKLEGKRLKNLNTMEKKLSEIKKQYPNIGQENMKTLLIPLHRCIYTQKTVATVKELDMSFSKFNEYCDGFSSLPTVQIETTRASVLNKMKLMVNEVKSKNRKLTVEELAEVLFAPHNYIKVVQEAGTLNEIQDCFAKCKDYCSRVHLTPQVQKVKEQEQQKRQEQRVKGLDKKKKELLYALEESYCNFIAKLPSRSILKKHKAKEIKKMIKNQINDTDVFSVLEDIEDDIDYLFDDLE